jgi:hypothetical protein
MVISMGTEGPVELELARNIAFLHWRLRRPQGYEAAMLAEKTASEPPYEIGATRRVIKRQAEALEVLASPNEPHADDEYLGAAIQCGHAVGLFMDDDWPTPRPCGAGAWNELIEHTLTTYGRTRNDAATTIERSIAMDRAFLHELLIREIGAVSASVIEEDLLLKVTRVEGHLGRELSRHYDLLHRVQRQRLASAGEA